MPYKVKHFRFKQYVSTVHTKRFNSYFLTLTGVSIGSDGSLSILGLLGAHTVCGCNQRHSPWKMAVFLMCLCFVFLFFDELGLKKEANDETGVGIKLKKNYSK